MPDAILDLREDDFSGGARSYGEDQRALLQRLRHPPILTAAERTGALAVARRGMLASDNVTGDVFMASVDLAGAGFWERMPLALITGAAGSGLIYRQRRLIAAGAGGAADDVTTGLNPLVGSAAGAWFLSDGWFDVSAGAAAGRTVDLRTAAAGAGTSLSGALSAAANGRQRFLSDPGAFSVLPATGLFLRRSDSAVGGTLVLDWTGR